MSRVGASVDRVTATTLGDGVLVTGREPGPAGLATVVLLGGAAELAVDVVEHDALVWLRLDHPATPEAVRLARYLLGPLAANRLAGSLGADGLLWDRATDEGDLDRWGQRDGAGLGTVGRLAVALAEATGAHRDDRAVALGLVEAGILALDLGPELAPSPTGIDLVRAGVARWQALDPLAFADDEPGLLQRIASLEGDWVGSVGALDPELADELGALAQGLVRHLGDPPAAAAGGARLRRRVPPPAAPLFELRSIPAPGAAAPRAAAPAAAADRAVGGAEAESAPAIAVSFSADLDARLIGVEHDGHHLRVHVGGLADDGPDPWLRVFAAGDRPTLLALAPFPDHDRPWRTALALLPAGLPSDQLLVDVTTRPAEPWVPARARDLARATQLGADAARAGRRADGEAQDRWDACADAWDLLGDEPRADAARRFAERRDPVGLGPLLVDDLR